MTKKTDMPVASPAARKTGKLIAVASGKGGVGKTWFSITLGHALALEGKKILLFDGDLGLANIDVQLGLVAKRDLGDVVEGHLGLESAIQKHEATGFDVLAGRSGHGSLSALPLQKLDETVKSLRALLDRYDAIIVDLGAGIDKTVRFIAAAADCALVVTNDEPTALTDAYAFIKLSHAAGHADNLRVVVNMTAAEKEGEATYKTLLKACKGFLKIEPPLAGIIRQDRRVRDAIRAQAPYLTRNPTTETAGDVTKIAERLVRDVLA